jgi:hypothetical protein
MVMNTRVLNLAVYLAAILTIAVVVNAIAAHPTFRWRADATKTRTYSLSDQTRNLLEDIEGDWTIAVVITTEGVDRALLRQIEQVLDRYDRASPNLSIVRIDPADPASLDRYEALLIRLRSSYAGPIAEYDAALDAGRDTLDRFTVFLLQQSGFLVSLGRALPEQDVARTQIEQLLAVISLRLDQVRQVEVELDRALTVDQSRPLADYETARSILAVSLDTWADEFFRIVELFNGWRDSPATDMAVRRFAATHREDYDGWVQELAGRADPLKQLPPLELARIGRSLEAGETAIVFGPHGAAVIPPQQLFARLNLRRRGSDTVAFDQRFRGEQAISAAIRMLADGGEMPVVVLVHAQDESLLVRRGQNIDFMGAAEILRASRFDVREWIVPRSEKPGVPRDRTTVWVVVPPPIPERTTLIVSEAEYELIDATHGLIADGEAVLLSLAPSALTRTGASDPWRALTAPFGLTVDTTRTVFESARDQEGQSINQGVIQLSNYPPGSAIGSAVHGLQTVFDLPLVITLDQDVAPDVRRVVVLAVEPGNDRWLETDWMLRPDTLDEPTADQRFDDPAPLVVAAERRNPVKSGDQRILVVGSGGWLLSYLADVVVPVGGDRMVLVNPGNFELLMAGITWLAGDDDRIASSPVSRQVARLEGVTESVQSFWRWVALAMLPGGCLALGIFVWTVRRH